MRIFVDDFEFLNFNLCWVGAGFKFAISDLVNSQLSNLIQSKLRLVLRTVLLHHPLLYIKYIIQLPNLYQKLRKPLFEFMIHCQPKFRYILSPSNRFTKFHQVRIPV